MVELIFNVNTDMWYNWSMLQWLDSQIKYSLQKILLVFVCFCRVDKNADGRLTEEEVKEVG